jgi:hypothetical protein
MTSPASSRSAQRYDAPSRYNPPTFVGARHLYPGLRRAVRIFPLVSTLHSGLNPFIRNAYKKDGGALQRPPRLDSLCRGAIHCALFTRPSHPAARNKRLQPHRQPTPTVSLTPLDATLTKTRGVLSES